MSSFSTHFDRSRFLSCLERRRRVVVVFEQQQAHIIVVDTHTRERERDF